MSRSHHVSAFAWAFFVGTLALPVSFGVFAWFLPSQAPIATTDDTIHPKKAIAEHPWNSILGWGAAAAIALPAGIAAGLWRYTRPA